MRKRAGASSACEGAWVGQLTAASACALAADPARLWVGARRGALLATGGRSRRFGCTLELDNHWRMLA